MGNAIVAPGLDKNSFFNFFEKSSNNPYKYLKWDYGVVPFHIEIDTFKEHPQLIEEINIALKNFNEEIKPYVRWRKKDERDEYWVRFEFHPDRTDSYVGRVGILKMKGQPIRVSPHTKYGNIMHEMAHSIGLGHEHQRIDRDAHYKVSDSQIEEDPANLMILENWDHNGEYDEDSIMKYGGQRKKFSDGDIKSIRSIYDKHQNNKCTFDLSGGKVYSPVGYLKCFTCYGEDSNYGVCYYCSMYCHEGHKLVPVAPRKGWKFYCDCGCSSHKDKCTKFSSGSKLIRQGVYVEEGKEEEEMCCHCSRVKEKKGEKIKMVLKEVRDFCCKLKCDCDNCKT